MRKKCVPPPAGNTGKLSREFFRTIPVFFTDFLRLRKVAGTKKIFTGEGALCGVKSFKTTSVLRVPKPHRAGGRQLSCVYHKIWLYVIKFGFVFEPD
jgi:hypothetical protein